jgi:N-acetylglucosaminyldiphosphoundecaprenol N-acetyl-beta-D-mannosaminyltransferase
MITSSSGVGNRADRVAPSLSILGVNIHAVDRGQLNDILSGLLGNGECKQWISYVNIYAINLAIQFEWFRKFLNDSFVTYCDGEGVRLGSKMLGNGLPERIVMSDWIYDVCRLCEESGYGIYLLGSTQVVVEKACSELVSRYKKLKILGCHHGHLTDAETAEVVSSINSLEPAVLVVGMGMPLQEEWIMKNLDHLNVKIILNAGSCFDFVSGFKRRCPEWMAQTGLEWLFRLIQEPKRLWKRYLIGNPLFMYRVLRQGLSRRSFS